MKKSKNLMGMLVFFTVLMIVSAIVTFNIVNRNNNPNPRVMEANLEGQNSESAIVEEKKFEIKSTYDLDGLFDVESNIYIKHPYLSSSLIEVGGQDKSFIAAYFKAIPKIKSTLEELQKSIFNFDEFDYQISLINSNIKINLYNESGFITINTNDRIEVFSLNEEKLNDFVKLIEETYIDKQINSLFKPMPSKMYINARDENNTYILSNKEIDEITKKFKIISIEKNSDYKGVPATYPDYYINIRNKDNEEYNVRLVNDEVMIIETNMLYFYCKYDKELWNYVTSKLPQMKEFKDDDLGYLFESEKLVVTDLSGEYNISNDTYYNLMIPRWIEKSGYKKINSDEVTLDGMDLKYLLAFFIDGQWKEVSIYENYIVFQKNIYFSKNIAEAIKSLLMMP